MDIIEMLKDEHMKVKSMFEQLEKTTAALKTRVEVLAKLESDLLVHMAFEEKVFYPEVKAGAEKEGKELTCEAYAEHEKQKASAAKAGKPAAPVAARH